MKVEEKIESYLNEKKKELYFFDVRQDRGQVAIEKYTAPALDQNENSKKDIVEELERNLQELKDDLESKQEEVKRYQNEKPISAEGSLVKKQITKLKTAVKQAEKQLEQYKKDA